MQHIHADISRSYNVLTLTQIVSTLFFNHVILGDSLYTTNSAAYKWYILNKIKNDYNNKIQ